MTNELARTTREMHWTLIRLNAKHAGSVSLTCDRLRTDTKEEKDEEVEKANNREKKCRRGSHVIAISQECASLARPSAKSSNGAKDVRIASRHAAPIPSLSELY